MTIAAMQPLSPELALPWSPDPNQEALFERWLKRAAIVLLLLFVVIPWLPTFEAEYVPPEREVIKTKVVLEDIKPLKKKPKPKAKPKPKQQLKQQPKTLKKKAPGSGSKAKPSTSTNQSQGLADLNSQLSALSGSLNVAGMRSKKVTTKNKGMVATADRGVLGENRQANASMGLEVDDSLMQSSSVQLASRDAANVQSSIGDGGGSSGNSAVGNYVAGRRDDESIRRTMDKNKGLLNLLYQRQLQQTPDIHGNFIFKMMIEPSGKISKVSLVSSELGVIQLENNLLNRIKLIDFGEADVKSTLVEYTYRFFPS